MHRPIIRWRSRRFVRLCACTLLIALWLGGFFNSASTVSASTVATANDTQRIVQRGIEQYESGDFLAAIDLWQEAYREYETVQTAAAMATVGKNLALAYQQTGQTAEEITAWGSAITAIQLLPHSPGNHAELGHLLTEKAQAYSRIGQHRQAIALLCTKETTIDSEISFEDCQSGSALQIAITSADTVAQVAALGSLGEAYRLSGEPEKASRYLTSGLDLVRTFDRIDLESALLNGLGSAEADMAEVNYRLAVEAIERGDSANAALKAAEGHNEDAIARFQQSYVLSQSLSQSSTVDQLRSLLSLIPAYIRAENWSAAQQHQRLAIDILKQTPNTQNKAFAAIKLASFVEAIDTRTALSPPPTTPLDFTTERQVASLLNQAIEIAESIESYRAKSFALGRLGHLDERAGRHGEALSKTQAARLAAENDLVAADSQYLWAWQTGRILKHLGSLESAESAYQEAIRLLEQVRSSILSANRDLQFDFRDAVEPVYRQYAALSLKSVPSKLTLRKGDRGNAFEKLDLTLSALDQLQIAELQSYFASDCVIEPIDIRIDKANNQKTTAIISTAILDIDRIGLSPEKSSKKQLAVIASFPNGGKKTAYSQVEITELAETIRSFRRNMELGRQAIVGYESYDPAPSEQIYRWLIEPFEDDLKGNAIDTLVFSNDGLLRSVPMAALYDGNQYLVERFAIATTPSLTLTDPQQVERPAALNVLLMGVSKASNVRGREFDELKGVAEEIKAIAQKFPNSKTLLNEDFSSAALRQEIAEKDYRILHMATHGTFEPNPTNSFVVMGAKEDESEFNESLTIRGLDELIRSASGPNREPIELLTLTACDTAIGDNRATLGLAGIAVRAGVRSAIASLWSVSDSYTATLISQFYDGLQVSSQSKAQALQAAQIAMIHSEDENAQHPYRWAPFVLIGNWL